MPDYIAPELEPLVERLRKRYPGVRIVEAHMNRHGDGWFQQNITYQAPVDDLKRSGILTAEMVGKIRDKDLQNRYAHGETRLGDGFSMSQGLYCYSMPECWDLNIYTGSTPREKYRGGTGAARGVLRRIFRPRKVGA